MILADPLDPLHVPPAKNLWSKLIHLNKQRQLYYQISSRKGGEESHGEGDTSDGDEDVGDVVGDDVEGVLEDALPRWIRQPAFGNVSDAVTHLDLFSFGSNDLWRHLWTTPLIRWL